MTRRLLLFACLFSALTSFSALAQTNDTRTVDESDAAAKTSPDTNATNLISSTGFPVRILGGSANTLMNIGEGRVRIAEPGGKVTYISATEEGKVVIREPGHNNVTYVTPSANGGMIIRGPDKAAIYVTPRSDGTVDIRSRSKSTFVTSSGDGTITIWGRNGKSYSVPMPAR